MIRVFALLLVVLVSSPRASRAQSAPPGLEMEIDEASLTQPAPARPPRTFTLRSGRDASGERYTCADYTDGDVRCYKPGLVHRRRGRVEIATGAVVTLASGFTMLWGGFINNPLCFSLTDEPREDCGPRDDGNPLIGAGAAGLVAGATLLSFGAMHAHRHRRGLRFLREHDARVSLSVPIDPSARTTPTGASLRLAF